jgi:hypothetical protein
VFDALTIASVFNGSIEDVPAGTGSCKPLAKMMGERRNGTLVNVLGWATTAATFAATACLW